MAPGGFLFLPRFGKVIYQDIGLPQRQQRCFRLLLTAV